MKNILPILIFSLAPLAFAQAQTLSANFVGGHGVRGLALDESSHPLGYYTNMGGEENFVGVTGGSTNRRHGNPIIVFELPEEGPVFNATLTFYKAGGTSNQRDVDLYGLDPTASGFALDETLFWEGGASSGSLDTRNFVTLIEAGIMKQDDPVDTQYTADVTSFLQSLYSGGVRTTTNVYFRLNLDHEQGTGLRRQEIYNEDGLPTSPTLMVTIPEPAATPALLIGTLILILLKIRRRKTSV